MSSRMNFGFSFGHPDDQPAIAREVDTPLRILVLSHLTGGGSGLDAQLRPPLAKRPLVRIDIDNFNEVMQYLSPRLQFDGAGAASTIDQVEFRELEDFRPEHLCQNLKSLRQLQDLRQELLNPKTFPQAAAGLRRGLLDHNKPVEIALETPKASSPPPVSSVADGASLLDQLLEQPVESGPGPAPVWPAEQSPFGLQQLIEDAVGPYIVPKADPEQQVYVAGVSKALSEQVRNALHAPAFQSLEATWRSLRKLVSSIDDDRQVQIFLLDVTYEELLTGFPTDDEQLQRWNLYRRLTADTTPDGEAIPWSLIVGDFQIQARPADISLLSALAATAERLQAPLIASAHHSLVGCSSLVESSDADDWQPLEDATTQVWQSLRQSSAATWVGLVLPRVLLRLPYGKETDEVESFDFEEFTAVRRHDDFLWGNPAYLCAELIAQAFVQDGWSMRLASHLDLDDLPAYTYSEDGEFHLQPCAEVALGGRAADAVLDRGLMPLISWRDRNSVRFARFQSIADPLAPLAGPWS